MTKIENFLKSGIKESEVLKSKSIRKRVFEFLESNPNANIYELYFKFPQVKKKLLNDYKYTFRKEYLVNLELIRNNYEIISQLLIIQGTKVRLLHQLSNREGEAILAGQEFVKKFRRFFEED